MEQAIKKAIEGGWGVQNGDWYGCPENITHTIKELLLLQPEFWQALGKSLGWGQEISRTKTGEEWGERFCLHCGVSTEYQPERKSGCNHAHYPEACAICSKKAITWKEQWHKFIDHLASGGSADDFFKDLLSAK